MIVLKSPEEIESMRVSCGLAARVRDETATKIVPGITTGEIAEFAKGLIEGAGAKCAFLGYRGFPGAICVSVNDEVVHGIPGGRVIQMGDVVSIDVGVLLDGFYGDTATTVLVGVTDPDVLRLIRTAKQSLDDGLGKIKPGRRLSDVSHAIQTTVEQAGYSVVRDFVGHGIGRTLHEDPQIPNFGAPNKGPKLRAGMTLAIEPMVNQGKAKVEVLSDGWTVKTVDGGVSAHVEHTVVVTEAGMEILTK